MNRLSVIFFLFIVFLFAISCDAQDTTVTSNRTVRVIQTRSESVPDSLVRVTEEEVNDYSAVPSKSDSVISKEVSQLLLESLKEKYLRLRGMSLLYTVGTDKFGKVKSVKLMRNYEDRILFEKLVNDYIFKLNMIVAFKMRKGKKIEILSSRTLQIDIL